MPETNSLYMSLQLNDTLNLLIIWTIHATIFVLCPAALVPFYFTRQYFNLLLPYESLNSNISPVLVSLISELTLYYYAAAINEGGGREQTRLR